MRRVALAILLALADATSLHAQILPEEPISIGNGRVVLAGDVTATVSGADPGFFNYTDYEYSALRNVRIGLAVEARATRWLQVLSDIRIDRTHVEPFAVYARLRPWHTRAFELHVGRVPPTFGAFARATYGNGNLLIAVPLAYQYLTSLRPDALPRTPEDLLRMRGRGWLSSFPLGVTRDDRGLPLINSTRSSEGVRVRGAAGLLEWAGALTVGALSNPRHDNGGRHLTARLTARPHPSLAVGASVARGEYLNRALAPVIPAGRRLEDATQRAWALDAEYSVGRILARAEMVASRWTLPIASSDGAITPLTARALLLEGRYRLWPGVHVAARGEYLHFGHVRAASGLARWEAPVKRHEIGAGYAFTRNIGVKASWQHSARAGGRIRRQSLGAAQVTYWF